MKEQIQLLIAAGRTEDALNLMSKSNNDAVLLLSRYNNGKKQYSMGLMDFGEWSRIQNQVNYAVLELSERFNGPAVVMEQPVVAPAPVKPAEPTKPTPEPATKKPKVFISYNHKDSAQVDKIQTFLERKGIDVTIDREDMKVTDKIKDFIIKNIKENDYILYVASNNSLKSGWVGFEQTLATFADLLDKTKVISVALDADCFSDDLPVQVARSIRLEIAELDVKIEEYKVEGIPYTNLTTKRQRLEKFRLGIADLFDRLQNSLTLDISDKNFKKNMDRVAKAILEG